MKKIKDKHASDSEWQIQQDLIKLLESKGWFVRVLHGNEYQTGLPDLLAVKRGVGIRFIEVKKPTGYKFQGSQLETFPRLMAEGCGVWLLIAATEAEYSKLFRPANWWQYLEAAK